MVCWRRLKGFSVTWSLRSSQHIICQSTTSIHIAQPPHITSHPIASHPASHHTSRRIKLPTITWHNITWQGMTSTSSHFTPHDAAPFSGECSKESGHLWFQSKLNLVGGFKSNWIPGFPKFWAGWTFQQKIAGFTHHHLAEFREVLWGNSFHKPS